MTTWEPGDVCVATVRGVPGVRIFRIDADPRLWVSSRCNHLRDDDDEVIDVRPLVVLDPEDRGQASRLAMLMQYAIDSIPYEHDDLTSEMADAGQAALREFANPTPPKPPEPTGLGAVVEDAEGRRWIRTCEPCEDCLNKPWQRGPVRRNWQIVTAVRVLSPGVQP